jgi:hypothetical protein
MPPAKKPTTRKKTTMTDDHKAALAQGREEGRAIRAYLEALDASAPKRGRKRTPESIEKNLADLDSKMATADALTRVHLFQQQLDLELELGRLQETVDISSLEAGFIKSAKSYSDRKGVTKGAWRAAGVPASVLKAAGV